MAAQAFAAQGEKTWERVGGTAISKEVGGGPTDWAARPASELY